MSGASCAKPAGAQATSWRRRKAIERARWQSQHNRRLEEAIMQSNVRSRARTRERPSRAEAEDAVRTLIRWAGDNPSRSGMMGTPARVARAYEEWFAGYREDPREYLS